MAEANDSGCSLLSKPVVIVREPLGPQPMNLFFHLGLLDSDTTAWGIYQFQRKGKEEEDHKPDLAAVTW